MAPSPPGLSFKCVSVLAFSIAALATSLAVQSPPAGTARFSGNVVDAHTQRAVAGVTVSIYQAPDSQMIIPMEEGGEVIYSGAGRFHGTVVTDQAGSFSFAGLPAGAFELFAQKPGWTGATLGQRAPGQPGRWRQINMGEQVTGAALSLWRQGLVAGRVIDDRGQPIINVTVHALRLKSMGGWPHRTYGASATTDDRGRYLMALHPGEYMLVTLTDPRISVPSTPRATPANGRARVFRTTYYPGSMSADGAATITVEAGQVQEAFDFQLIPSFAFRVRASAADVAGSSLGPRDRASLVRPGEGINSRDQEIAYAIWDGSGFTFEGVPEGRYAIRFFRPPVLPMATHGLMPLKEIPTDPTWWVDQPFLVVDGDVNVPLDIRQGVRLSGRVEFDGTRPRPTLDALNQRALAIANASGEYGNLRGFFDSLETFGTMQIPAGRYLIRPGALEGWHLKSVTASGRDVADTPLEVGTTDVTNLLITFTDRAATLTGRVVTDSANAAARPWVTIFPAERESWRDYGPTLRRLAVIQTGTTGQFSATLPEGRYYAVATDNGLGLMRTPETFESLAASAVVVSLMEGHTTSQDLRVQRGR